ncbi:MAG: efflux RND transporter periplasmic adaptor subunit, partial [Gemmatimonadales bacterium]|nr:efflux RND transporter periplasmic adaptor subunit [Gemmatimonadales bacterium]
MKWSRLLLVVPPVLLLALVLGCGAEAPPPPPPPGVTVAAVPEREVREWDEFIGRMEAVEAVQIRPRVSGYIQRVAFNEGNGVRKGQVLFEIDPRPYLAAMARAEAELEVARARSQLAGRDVVRAQRLVAVQAISREEMDSRSAGQEENEAAVRAAEAAVATARLDLEWTKV